MKNIDASAVEIVKRVWGQQNNEIFSNNFWNNLNAEYYSFSNPPFQPGY